jgi:hypothetical protein
LLRKNHGCVPANLNRSEPALILGHDSSPEVEFSATPGGGRASHVDIAAIRKVSAFQVKRRPRKKKIAPTQIRDF